LSQSQGVAAVDRALSILDAFRDSDGCLSLKDIAEATGLYKSTSLRLLASLERFGYVHRLDEGRYQIGPKPAELSAVYQRSFNLRDYVVPALNELVNEVNESASLYVRVADQRLCLFRVESKQVLRDHIQEGDTLPLDVGASGKVLRFYSDHASSEFLAALQSGDFVTRSVGERQPDMAALAAPIFGIGGKFIGALSISGPRSRIDDAAMDRLERSIRRVAINLSIRLGAPPDRLPTPT